jgi:glycosyltransferase involved in cell wall biosynthesis
MKLLIVCSINSGRIAPFIEEQGDALAAAGVEVEYYKVQGKGLWGYVINRKHLIKKIREFHPHLIHAHYGLSGLLANLQRNVPVITTYHGSDINDSRVFLFSKIAVVLSAYNIFVSEKNRKKAGSPKNSSLIPCGVDLNQFQSIDKTIARKKLGMNIQQKYILFAGTFSNPVKNSELAIKSVERLENVRLLELKGYTREEVALLMNAVDVVLMTSFSEGSPQFIKEAMVCGCPVVSVPVGDVPELISALKGCYLTTYNVEDVTYKLQQAFMFAAHTEGRKRIIKLKLDSESVVKQLIEIYNSL